MESHSLGRCKFASNIQSGFFVDEKERVLVDATTRSCSKCSGGEARSFEPAGPRRRLFFESARVTAGIVTCGGLCPGLNDVIRATTMVLYHRYGVRRIFGFRYGYEGLLEKFGHKSIRLDPELVADIHQNGGTILGSSRGEQDVGKTVDFLVKERIDVLFTIGGDGTQRGALDITRELKRRGLKKAVIGIPKTIDNDIMYTDRTFGFETAVAMTSGPIEAAHMESKGVRNGVGLVKLMGRDSGFVAAYAALASSDVNLVLVPEVPFKLEKVMTFLEKRLVHKEHCVIVVAEGAGSDLIPAEGKDASGNVKYGDIGLFLKKAISEHMKARGVPVAVRYIDPSYTIRGVPANSDDSAYCFMLAEMAVHAAMAGKTGIVVGSLNGHFVHIPAEMAVSGRKKICPDGLLWQSVIENTGQPDLS